MPRPTKHRGLAVALMTLLPMGYVLSAGPVGRLLPPKHPVFRPTPPRGSPCWEIAYKPLLWATDRWPIADDAARWYLKACGAYDAASICGSTRFHTIGVDRVARPLLKKPYRRPYKQESLP